MTNSSIEMRINRRASRKRKLSIQSKEDDKNFKINIETDDDQDQYSSDEKEGINRKSLRLSGKTSCTNNDRKLNGAQFIAAASVGNLPASYSTILSKDPTDLNKLFQNIDQINKVLNNHSILFKKINASIEKLSEKLDLTIRVINKAFKNSKKGSNLYKTERKKQIKYNKDDNDDYDDDEEKEEHQDHINNYSAKKSDSDYETESVKDPFVKNNNDNNDDEKVGLSTVTLENINNEELDDMVSNSNQNKISSNLIDITINKEKNNENIQKSNSDNSNGSKVKSSTNNDLFSDSSNSDESEDQEESESDDEDYNRKSRKAKRRRNNNHKGLSIAILNKTKIDTEFISTLISNKDPNDKRYDPNEINKIRLLSHSYQNFAVKLLIRLFDEEEIYGRNVYGRNYSGDKSTMKQPLDPERINFIKETVLRLTKTNNPELAWASCVIAMNRKMVDINNKLNKNQNKNTNS